MKFVACQKCHDSMQLVGKYTRTCFCGAVGGKYLDDNITAVVSKDAIVFGIDNFGFEQAKTNAVKRKNLPYRYDFFFSGWIPTKPGEVIIVETVEDVLAYPYEMKDEDKIYDSTWPSRIMEQHENLEKKKLLKENSIKLVSMMEKDDFGDIDIQETTGLMEKIRKFIREIKDEWLLGEEKSRNFWV